MPTLHENQAHLQADDISSKLLRSNAASEIAISVIKENLRRKTPILTMAGAMGTADGAKIGYLINQLLGRSAPLSEKRYTLFANSTLEALNIVIRLCRQIAYESGRAEARKVLVLDQKLRYATFFDPLKRTPDAALCPQIYFADSEADFRDKLQLNRDQWACIIVVSSQDHLLKAETQKEIDKVSEETGAAIVVCNSDQNPADPSLFVAPENAHIVIFGENLTNGEAPFAAFCPLASVYAAWETHRSLRAYHSTFAGNGMALAAAVKTLVKYANPTDADLKVLADIEDSIDERIRYFAEYVDPTWVYHYTSAYAENGKNVSIVRAEGATLTLSDGRTILDVGSLGCALRGHSPGDVVGGALAKYDSAVDYFELLEKRVREVSRFSRVIPSVSGAGAVDNAIIMALLAQPGRSKIVCFTGNYSGKTLISVNLSKTGPIVLNGYNFVAFGPHYNDVIYIDPTSEDAENQFLQAVSEGDVALVWFELIQGYMFKRLPSNIVRTVEEHKESCGYLIGVDEVLTGMWKNGRTMLAHQEQMTKVDLVSMSKATSDMNFPVSWALVTEDVYREARANDRETVEKQETIYRYNLGGLIGLNAVETGRAFFENNDLTMMLGSFLQRLKKVVSDTDLFDDVTAEGSLIRFHLNKKWFPYHENSMEAVVVESEASKLLMHAAGILVSQLRIFLPSIHDATLHQALVDRLEANLPKLRASILVAYLLSFNYETLEALGMTEHFRKLIRRTTAPLELSEQKSWGDERSFVDDADADPALSRDLQFIAGDGDRLGEAGGPSSREAR